MPSPEFAVISERNVPIPEDWLTRIRRMKFYSEDQPRDEAGRWTDAGGGGSVRVDVRGALDREDAAAFLLDATIGDGGFTYQPIDHAFPHEGYAVSLFPEREVIETPGSLNVARIAAYMKANEDLLKDPSNHVGGWLDKQSGKVFLDISRIVESAGEAKKLGIKFNQKAFYDLKRHETVTIQEVHRVIHSAAVEAVREIRLQAGDDGGGDYGGLEEADGAAREEVRARFWREDQARDDHGRWTDEGGDGRTDSEGHGDRVVSEVARVADAGAARDAAASERAGSPLGPVADRYISEREGRGDYSHAFAAGLRETIPQLPASAQELLEARWAHDEPPYIQEIDLSKAPDFIQRQMRDAEAATLNGYKIMYAQGKLPSVESLTHELAHATYAGAEAYAAPLVKEAQDEAKAVGASMLKAAYLPEWRMSNQPAWDDDISPRLGAKWVRLMDTSIRRYVRAGKSDVTGALELDLAIPNSDLKKFAETLGHKTAAAGDQWHVVAIYSALAAKHNVYFASQYGGEEMVTYKAGKDRNYASRLFAAINRKNRFSAQRFEYDEALHPRDEAGRWTDSGGAEGEAHPGSPEFKKWFKGSKVVDEKGAPLRVYHGTANDFDEFRDGQIWFAAEPRVADLYGDYSHGGRIIPIYVSLKNPQIVLNTTEGMQEYANPSPNKPLRDYTKPEPPPHDGVLFVNPDGRVVRGYALKHTQIRNAITHKLMSAEYVEEDHPRDERGWWVEKGAEGEAAEPGSREFEKWFGQSVVTDDVGHPLRVYHGTPVWEKPTGQRIGDFDEFNRNAVTDMGLRPPGLDQVGIWFSDNPEAASVYGGLGAVIPVYLAIENPWETTWSEFIAKFRETAGLPKEPRPDKKTGFRPPIGRGNPEPLRAWLRSQGYDGIKFSKRELIDFSDKPQDIYVALEHTQIRNAITHKLMWSETQPRRVDVGLPGGQWVSIDAGSAEAEAEKNDPFFQADHPVIAFHGTTADNLAKIKREGITLKPDVARTFAGGRGALYEGERGESIFVTTDPLTAAQFADMRARYKYGPGGGNLLHPHPVVLSLVVPVERFKQFKEDIAAREDGYPGSIYGKVKIEPEWIAKAYAVKWTPGKTWIPKLTPLKFSADTVSAWAVIFVEDDGADVEETFAAVRTKAAPPLAVGERLDLADDLYDAYVSAYREGEKLRGTMRGVMEPVSRVPVRAREYAEERAAELVTNIDETTRNRMAEIVAQSAGEGDPDSVLADKIEESFLFTPERAQLIARTEAATAYNMGTIHALKDAGEQYVYVDDGDEWDEACINANGEIWTLEEAEANPLEHPNCQRMFRPLTGEELAEVEAEEAGDSAVRLSAQQKFWREDQERAPAGSSEGGQFVSEGEGGGGSAPEKPAPMTREQHRMLLRRAEAEWIKEKDYTINDENAAMHRPAGPDGGSPLYDLGREGTYPEDVYSYEGLRYYGSGGIGEEARMDQRMWGLIHQYEARPNAPVAIYRAVGLDDNHGIMPGSWVTPVRAYAKQHGESTLQGKYKIVSKTVYARDLFTDGNSWFEWGYHPQEPKLSIRDLRRKYAGEFSAQFSWEDQPRDENNQKWVDAGGGNAALTREPVKVNGKVVEGLYTEGNNIVVMDDPDDPEDVRTYSKEEWVNDWNTDPSDYFPDYEDEFNRDFWEMAPTLYHGTNADNVSDIEKEGLKLGRGTGITNRGEVGVFTSTEPEFVDYYYGRDGRKDGVLYAIDTAAMKRDGVMPYVSQEPEVREGELRSALAHAIGLEDYDPGVASDMDPQTVIVHGLIPPKYLKRYGRHDKYGVMRFYREDQARDDHGRWVEEGGEGTGAGDRWPGLADATILPPPPINTPPPKDAIHAKDFTDLSPEAHAHRVALKDEIARELGYPPEKIEVKNELGVEQMIEGQLASEAGYYEPATGTTVILANAYRGDAPNKELADNLFRGTVAHEINHAKFDAVVKAYGAEQGKAFPDADTYANASDEARAKAGPISAVIEKSLNNLTALMRSDGVTDYSHHYWLEVQRGPLYLMRKGIEPTEGMRAAVRETLAEISNVLYANKGTERRAELMKQIRPEWRRLYRDTLKAYDKLTGKTTTKGKTA